MVFRTYCSQLPVDRRRHIRPPILPPVGARPGDVVGRYLAALQAGDTDAIVGTFTSQGYVREPIDAHLHRGAHELRAYFDRCFSAGGGVGLQHCAVTDDGVALRARVQLRQLGALTRWRPRPGWASTNGVRTACWPRPASTTTSSGAPNPLRREHEPHHRA